ncbi:MAG: alanine/glycine:cation symporter family protein [Saprospiraceae bacterium]
MKPLYKSTLAFFTSLILFIHSISAQAANDSRGIDELINDAFMPFAVAWENLIFTSISIGTYDIPIVLIVLIGGALFFTFYFRLINLRKMPLAIQIVRGKYDHLEKIPERKGPPAVHELDGDIVGTIKDESIHGEVNHFQALTTAVSGTVGLGNIAMVAVAISVGGPGATFWMIVEGLLGMSTKMVECTLGVRYRDISSDGQVFGGPMYYLSRGLKEQGFEWLGKILSVVFAVLCVGASFGGGNAFQSNQAAAQIISRFDLESAASGTIIGCVIALLAGVVIIGGIKRIAKVTEKVVPFMALFYVGSALFILIVNYQLVDDAFRLIFQEAFSPRATITGGIIGVMIQGFRRAAFSNEAGAGSAAIAHAAVNTKHPASEGLVALLEPLIDTVIICTMTALVIIIFNMETIFQYGDVVDNEALLVATGERVGGVNLTSMAFDHSIPGFSYALAIAVVLFAFSTILSWSYYGLQSWKFLFGRSRMADMTYKIVFLLFTILGSAVTMDAVIKFSDAMILALVFPNMIGLFFLFPLVRKELDGYFEFLKK